MSCRLWRIFIISVILEGVFLFSVAYWLAKYDVATQQVEKLFYAFMIALTLGALVINTINIIESLRED